MTLPFPDIGATARSVPRLDDRRRDSRRLEPDPEREPTEAGADDDGISGPFSYFHNAVIALPIGTGGRPLKMRILSPSRERPA